MQYHLFIITRPIHQSSNKKAPKTAVMKFFAKIFEKFLQNNNGHPVKIQRIRRIVTDIQFSKHYFLI